MDLVVSMNDAFDRVAKKQKLSSTKSKDVIDSLMRELQQASSKLHGDAAEVQAVLAELRDKLSELGPVNQVGSVQKEVNLAVSKYGKMLDKQFCTDLSKAYREMEFDNRLMNQIIALHFYRQGLFELGDCFVNESQETSAAALKVPFYEMYQILEQIRSKNLQPAIEWAKSHHKELQDKGSSLEFKLHQLEFVQTLLKSGRWEALVYGRRIFGAFPDHLGVIKKLMALLIYFARGEGSSNPYNDLLSPANWETVALEFTRECCSLLGQGYESPLHVTVSAGSQALPTLIKLASVMSNKKNEWVTMKQLPVEIELDKEFQFHSIFACPVSRDQSTADNPPMLLPCGHVLCKQSIHKLAKGNSRPFKCPYCPTEATSASCKQIHF